jgi:hypothetical protein
MDIDGNGGNTVLHDSIDPNEMGVVLLETLSVEDWVTIENVRTSFLSIVQDDNVNSFLLDVSNRTSAIISWSQFADRIALRLIRFFRQINKFEDLDADDRFILTKYNLFPLFPIYKCFNYKPTNNFAANEVHEEAIRLRRFYMLFDESYDTRDTLIDLILSIAELTERDSTLVSLLLVVLIFSPGLSMNEDEPTLKDPLAVNRAQSYYTILLWKYLVNKLGEAQTYKYFIQLLAIIYRIQSGSKIFRDFARIHCVTPDGVDNITPLIQTVLNIS